jgi:hypothetical protein
MTSPIERPTHFRMQNGDKVPLPFSDAEYERRLAKLRAIMTARDVPAVLMTSMHNIAYYSGFLYCSFGRLFGCVVTQDTCTTVSANIDGGQPGRRSFGDNIIYTDWRRGNFWRAVRDLLPAPGKLGIEADHLTLTMRANLADLLGDPELVDVAPDAMAARMVKSEEEIQLIRGGARVADIGGEAIRKAIGVGTREIDVAMAGRDAMETAIADAYPDSEMRDSWVWFQSGINTDGAHNPVTCRKLQEAPRVRSSPPRSTVSSRRKTCCSTVPSATGIPSASCRTTTAARRAWNFVRISTRSWSPAWWSPWNPCSGCRKARRAPAATASTTSWWSARPVPKTSPDFRTDRRTTSSRRS